MDVFSRTFLPAAAEAGVAIPTVSRHMPVFRRCVEADDTAVLVARCLHPDRPLQGEFLLVLTHRRLVVTQETRLLRRLRLHLNAELRHLATSTGTRTHSSPRSSSRPPRSTASVSGSGSGSGIPSSSGRWMRCSTACSARRAPPRWLPQGDVPCECGERVPCTNGDHKKSAISQTSRIGGVIRCSGAKLITADLNPGLLPRRSCG